MVVTSSVIIKSLFIHKQVFLNPGMDKKLYVLTNQTHTYNWLVCYSINIYHKPQTETWKGRNKEARPQKAVTIGRRGLQSELYKKWVFFKEMLVCDGGEGMEAAGRVRDATVLLIVLLYTLSGSTEIKLAKNSKQKSFYYTPYYPYFNFNYSLTFYWTWLLGI